MSGYGGQKRAVNAPAFRAVPTRLRRGRHLVLCSAHYAPVSTLFRLSLAQSDACRLPPAEQTLLDPPLLTPTLSSPCRRLGCSPCSPCSPDCCSQGQRIYCRICSSSCGSACVVP